MTLEEAREHIKSMDSKQKQDVLEFIYTSPFYNQYVAYKIKSEEITEYLSNNKIDLKKGDEEFEAFIKIVPLQKNIDERIDFYHKKLNVEELKKAEEAVTKARRVSLEARVLNRQRGG